MFRILSVVTVLISSASALLAQVPPPGNTTPSNVPIDGGVVTVVGASIVYGAKKLYDRNKSKRGE